MEPNNNNTIAKQGRKRERLDDNDAETGKEDAGAPLAQRSRGFPAPGPVANAELVETWQLALIRREKRRRPQGRPANTIPIRGCGSTIACGEGEEDA